MRIFLDANVLFSAAKSDGAVRRLLQLLRTRGHQTLADAWVESEARRNLIAKGPEAIHALDALLADMQVAAAHPSPSRLAEVQWLPEKDRPVLAAAIRLRCNALVTGDRKHFGSGYGRVFGGVTIHAPASLAVAVLAGN